MKLISFLLFTGCFSLLTSLKKHQSNNSKNIDSTDYTITGNIKGIDKGWIYVKHRQTDIIDSAHINNGSFMIKGKTETPEFCNIGTGNTSKRDFYFGFFLGACNMKLNANKDSLFDAAITFEGYRVQDEFKNFQKKMRPIDIICNEIWTTNKTPNNKDSLNLKLNELDKKRKAII